MELLVFLIFCGDNGAVGKVVKIKIKNEGVINFLQEQAPSCFEESLRFEESILLKIKESGCENYHWKFHRLTLFCLAGEKQRGDVYDFLLRLSDKFLFNYMVY
jgi:hypothetical protein